jgi:CubicO group peptidase (beta-lactamase class C family)
MRLPAWPCAALLWGALSGSVAPAQAPPPDLQRLRDTMAMILDAGVRDSVFPGAFAVIGTRDRVLVERAAGHLDWAPSPAPNDSTLWDLASLTKVVALTTTMMQLWERGLVDLDAPVQRYLPAFQGARKERVTVRDLLTHSSGLPAWRPLYLEGPTPDSILALVYATPLDTTPGATMVYSDLGAILLGQIVERLTGQSFDEYVAERIFEPLGMRDTRFRPPQELWDGVAPTEVDTAWRRRHVRGEVHDENAFALGGVSSHAGLFGSGRDLARFARMLLRGGGAGWRTHRSARNDRHVHDAAGLDPLPPRVGLGEAQRAELGGAPAVAAGVRAHRVHGDVALGGPGAGPVSWCCSPTG